MEISNLGVNDDSIHPVRLEKLRTCGRLETYSTARHSLSFYRNVGLTATYISSFKHEFTLENLVYAALHHVIKHHPNLSVVPINEHVSYPEVYFGRLPEIDLRVCVEFFTRKKPIPRGDEPDQELDEVLRRQHNIGFHPDPRTRPYWRLIVISSSQTPGLFSASWIFHHALSDGASSVLFHESFLEGLNDASLQKEVNALVKTPSTPLLPPLEDLHSMKTTWSFFLHAIACSLFPSYFAPRLPGLWTGHPIHAIVQTPSFSHNTTVALSAEITTAFVKKCRREETSVTAALSALLAAVLFRHVNPHDKIKIDMPISLRPFLNIPKKSMVNAITNHTSTFHFEGNDCESTVEGFSWSTARQVKNELVKEVAKNGTDNPFALLKYIKSIHEYFLNQLGQPRSSSAEVSNLGGWNTRQFPVLDGTGRRGGWLLGRMTFSQGLNHTGSQISLSVVTGGDGCMVLSFNWPEEPVLYDKGGRDFMHRIPELMKRGIEVLLQNDQPQ